MTWRRLSFLASLVGGLVPAVAQQERFPPARSDAAKPVRRAPLAPPGWERIGEEGRRMAAEAAREDAQEQIFRRVCSLRLTPALRVQEVVQSSPAIAEGLRRAIAGAEFSTPHYSREQICEVRGRMPLSAVAAELKRLIRLHGQGRFPDGAFESLPAAGGSDAVVVVGQGVPALGQVPRAGMGGTGAPPEWATTKLRAEGTAKRGRAGGSPASQKLQSVHQARSAATRSLDEQVRALPVPGAVAETVGALLDRRPDAGAPFDEWLRGGRVVETDFTAEGAARVVVEVDLSTLWPLIAPLRTTSPLPPLRQRARPHR